MNPPYNHESYTACTSELEFEEFKVRALVGQKAPDFFLRDLDSHEFTLADFRGRYLALDFGSIT